MARVAAATRQSVRETLEREGSRLARGRHSKTNSSPSAEGRKSGKVMIMKNFKASLLFVPPLARPIGGGAAERRDGEGEGREMLEEELTS